MSDAAQPEKTANFIIEEEKPLSKSLIWQLQNNLYAELGVDAWSDNQIPHYITNSPYIAKSYAEVVIAYLRDCWDTLAHDEPVYIIEIGSGTGRLAYHFLESLHKYYPFTGKQALNICYVMTDISQDNIDYWRQHRAFQPFAEKGLVDFANFNAVTDTEIELLVAGKVLKSGSEKNPIITFANYLFDSIPQDIFFISQGKLYEGLITLGTEEEPPADLTSVPLTDIVIKIAQQETTTDYYGDPDLDNILKHYMERLGNTAVSIPTHSIYCLRNLQALSEGKLLLLSADKGMDKEDILLERGKANFPHFQYHGGTISMVVNFNAIGKYFQNQGGKALHTHHLYSNINVSAFAMNPDVESILATERAFYNNIELRGPDDFFILREVLEKKIENISVEESLAYLRLSNWDYSVFYACFPIYFHNTEHIKSTSLLSREVRRSLQRTWEMYYDIGEVRGLAYYIAMLLTGIEYYADALEFFELALQEREAHTGIYHNMAICYFKLRQLDQAAEYVNKALELNPELEEARTLRIQIEAEVERKSSY